MSRQVSSTFRGAVNAQRTPEVILMLLEIDTPEITESIRLVNNTEDIISNGNNYIRFPFEINLPNDSDEGNTRVQLTIDNVDRRIVQAVRETGGPITAKLIIVLASNPDLVELGPYDFRLTDVSYDSQKVTANLEFEDILNARFPSDSFVPSSYPGLF